jgi:pimeloyl-ACP methyl ester carboxylesterase
MDYVVSGGGHKTLLHIPGGPGSEVPKGLFGRLADVQAKPYLEAGYSVWSVTRPRNMPTGHTVADMAEDYARFVREELEGRVDLVVGESYGGMISLYLAANHPESARLVVVALAAATLTESGRALDLRWARQRAAGRHAEAGATVLEYLIPGSRLAPLRRIGGYVVGPIFARADIPVGDLIVEAEAEAAYDARDVLSRITVPVLMICGDADEFFSRAAVEETAAAIPDCTLIWYPGFNHVRAGASRQRPRDILAWVARREAISPRG